MIEDANALGKSQAWRSGSVHLDFQECFESLTPRERQVMWLIVDGNTSKEIASQLDISSRTVEVHRGHLMTKMRAKPLARLVRLAVLHGRP